MVHFSSGQAEEAIARTGKTHPGQLIHTPTGWIFTDRASKAIDIRDLSYVRFDAQSTPLPKLPLTRTLLLPNQQHISGRLQSIDLRSVAFTTLWGQAIVLPREQVIGIEQAGDCVPLLHDDFENDKHDWRIDGKATRDPSRPFTGKASLRLDAATQSATRAWTPALRDGNVRLFFCDPGGPNTSRWTITLIVNKEPTVRPGIVIDRNGYAAIGVKQKLGEIAPSSGWRLLSFEMEDGRLRIFVDDHCLGQSPLPIASLGGIRCDPDKRAGRLWIDDLIVAKRLPPQSRPASDPKQDSLWLVQGEQLFGQLVSADAKTTTLDAKFGKRSLAWTQMRGILFASPNAVLPSNEPAITFRPCPGFPVDELRAKLLRWDGTKLIVQHELLGEIAIERERLEKIRFAAK